EMTTGLMAAKLTGGKVAQGDVIAFIDCHCSPQEGWWKEILQQVTLNPRRMVVPAITDLDLDTFDEKEQSAVNAKCYLTFDADFKWFDDESDFIPTISGGLVAMGREWFNLTGGFDEEMHGWGGENLDQSLRAWLCGGEISRAKSSRVAHMWRTGDSRTATHYSVKARGTNNRGRVVAAWFDAFIPVYRGGRPKENVDNYDRVKKALNCKPFSYFVYRFRKIYLEGGIIAREIFRLRDKASGLCLLPGAGWRLAACPSDDKQGRPGELQLGNIDRDTGKCCSGLRIAGTNDCWDAWNDNGPGRYSCDVSGSNANQYFRLRADGRIHKGIGECVLPDAETKKLIKKPCSDLQDSEGIFEKIAVRQSQEYQIYLQELELHRWAEKFPDLPDN
ncbi:unnamed protein product, partial [Polarella glacialis]